MRRILTWGSIRPWRKGMPAEKSEETVEEDVKQSVFQPARKVNWNNAKGFMQDEGE